MNGINVNGIVFLYITYLFIVFICIVFLLYCIVCIVFYLILNLFGFGRLYHLGDIVVIIYKSW